jgi:hypothetical protein
MKILLTFASRQRFAKGIFLQNLYCKLNTCTNGEMDFKASIRTSPLLSSGIDIVSVWSE